MRFLYPRSVGLVMAALGLTSLFNARTDELAYAAQHKFIPHDVGPIAIVFWILTWGLILLLSPNATLEQITPTTSTAPIKFYLLFGSIAFSVVAAYLYLCVTHT